MSVPHDAVLSAVAPAHVRVVVGDVEVPDGVLRTVSPGGAHAVDLDTPDDLARWQHGR